MPNQIELKDAEQDQEIALLKHRVEQLEKGSDAKMIEELRDRVRKLERWVWGAAAVITTIVTLAGIVVGATEHGSNDPAKQEVVLQLSRS